MSRRFKRRLFELYQKFVPKFIKKVIPRRMKAWVLGSAFVLTRHPELRFKQVVQLTKAGLPIDQAELYNDPLLHCTLEKIQGRSDKGWFKVDFNFNGIVIQGEVGDFDQFSTSPQNATVDMLLNDEIFRRVSISATNGKFRQAIRRKALWMFPKVSEIQVLDSGGHKLSLGRHSPDFCAARLYVPDGDGSICCRGEVGGRIDKKGWPISTPAEIDQRQMELLALYDKCRKIFAEEFGKPLLSVYGTLLGFHRNGDFIPGDDDFDVAYVSQEKTAEAVKAEAIRIMERLVECGFTVFVNNQGRPFRLRAKENSFETHLDVHVLFSLGDEHTWLHPRARLALDIDTFNAVDSVVIRGVEVLKPRHAEGFLEAYYGEGWRVPDPSYSFQATSSDPMIAATLTSACLSLREQRAMSRRIKARNLTGEFVAVLLEDPYPLSTYAVRVGL
jgi:hypothetical protein